MSIEKNYINGIVIKEKVFQNGGKQLKGWVKVDEFILIKYKSINNFKIYG